MPTQISMSGGKKSKKLIRVLVPNKHVWWKNPKFTGMNFGTDTIIDFLNIGQFQRHGCDYFWHKSIFLVLYKSSQDIHELEDCSVLKERHSFVYI